MPDSDRYRSGTYWQDNPSMHEQDARFKVANARKILTDNVIVPASIIDYGCGSGLIAFEFATAFNVPVIGLDISEVAISRARATYVRDNLRFENPDLGNQPSPASLGIMFDVFEHVEDCLAFLRAARPRAEFWLFNVPLDLNCLNLLRRSALLRARRTAGHLHYFSRETAVATINDAGYQIVDTRLINNVRHNLSTTPTMLNTLAALPRLVFLALGRPEVLGGASLMVLARSGEPVP